MPLALDLQCTSRARMTPVAECRDETNLPVLRRSSNGPHSILRPNTTESKTLQVVISTDVSQPETRATKRNQKPLQQNNQERTNRNTTDTTEGPETTTRTPFAKQHI